MDDKILNKLLTKVKNKFTKQKQSSNNNYEYAFSDEEIEDINKKNKQKILELKQGLTLTKKQDKKELNSLEVLSKLECEKEVTEPINKLDNCEEETIDSELKKVEDIKISYEEATEELKSESVEDLEEDKNEETIKEEPQKNSFINLNLEHQKLVMNKWKEINLNKIDKDIIEAKDLLNHNYTSYYASDALKFIKYIRKEYEIVVCYLIGFNNEKQGIMNKTIFGDSIDEEWKYLSNYIKILEKIRKNK